MSRANKLVIHPNDIGLYTNVFLAPTFFKTKSKNKSQLGWDNMYAQLQKTILKKVDTPYAVYMSVGNISFFDSINCITNNDIIDTLNKKGFKIYLYEPISTYTKNSTGLYAEYENNDVDVYSHELDSIQSYVKRNKLTNVQVYAPNHNLKKYFKNKYPELSLFCTPIGWIYPATIDIDLDTITSNTIEKKFWCGNWRYTSTRHAIASYLIDKYADTTHLSWLYKSNSNDLREKLWFDIDNLLTYKQQLISGADKLERLAPITMDISVSNALSIDDYIFIDMNTNPKQFYQQSFCAIINETRFAEPTQLLTEKTMHAIINHRPFILVGPPHSLKYMKKWGWKTFDKWFDESYDDEECHYKRLEKILKLIDDIGMMSINELKVIYEEMKPILDHNSNFILRLQKEILSGPITKNKLFKRIQHDNKEF